ncbi:hypothetical protein TNCV_1124321 [Trichonephila clavipes]|uniref:Uncharacterized protein n=1 Tax=Trichonephila clavipes TaxID=2585209 RepID=A0A8X6VLP2_TRICX|nr:hypothetical protein TNCV_1124321 [Trichonephila clavipes]
MTTCIGRKVSTIQRFVKRWILEGLRAHRRRSGVYSLTGYDILPWTANSPDLNLIEHLLNLIGHDMNRETLAQTMDDLCSAVSVFWQWLLQASFNEQIERMPRWIEACISAQDRHFRY